MHNFCTYSYLNCEACNKSTWTWIPFQWIWGTPNTNNILFDSCSLSPSIEIGLRFNRLVFSYFFGFTWLPPKSPFVTLSLENLNEVQRCSELLHRDSLHHYIRWILFVLIFTKSITLSSTTHWRILWYLTSMCFILLWYPWSLARWIALWLSQWTRTESCMMLNVSTIHSITKLPLKPQLQPCTPPLSLRATVSFNSAF